MPYPLASSAMTYLRFVTTKVCTYRQFSQNYSLLFIWLLLKKICLGRYIFKDTLYTDRSNENSTLSDKYYWNKGIVCKENPQLQFNPSNIEMMFYPLDGKRIESYYWSVLLANTVFHHKPLQNLKLLKENSPSFG